MSCHFVFVIGTRAQLIKVAPVIVAFEREKLPVSIITTGQHLDTMDDLFEEFKISSTRAAVVESREHSTVLSLVRWLPKAYRRLGRALADLRSGYPGRQLYVFVHGDTLSTLVAALAARRCRATVVHLESGLSSGNLFDPFPEELLRRTVFRLTDIAMCPNEAATARMRRRKRVEVVPTDGNTIVDAVRLAGIEEIHTDSSNPYLLVSLHRFQNLYALARLQQLAQLVHQISDRFQVRFVLHPTTRSRLAKAGLLDALSSNSNVQLLPRVGYREFIRLAAGARCVLTDGGSNQEELAALGVPTIIMRPRTERPDGVGSNAILEGAVPGGVGPFVRDGCFENLRRAPFRPVEDGPSEKIVRHMGMRYSKGQRA